MSPQSVVCMSCIHKLNTLICVLSRSLSLSLSLSHTHTHTLSPGAASQSQKPCRRLLVRLSVTFFVVESFESVITRDRLIFYFLQLITAKPIGSFDRLRHHICATLVCLHSISSAHEFVHFLIFVFCVLGFMRIRSIQGSEPTGYQRLIMGTLKKPMVACIGTVWKNSSNMKAHIRHVHASIMRANLPLQQDRSKSLRKLQLLLRSLRPRPSSRR
jgi:hypothetical protein